MMFEAFFNMFLIISRDQGVWIYVDLEVGGLMIGGFGVVFGSTTPRTERDLTAWP